MPLTDEEHRSWGVAPNGDTEHGITNDLAMDELDRLTYAQRAWAIEEYHRGLKQFTEAKHCPARLAHSQNNHLGLALQAFVRLEWHRLPNWRQLVRGRK